MILENLVTFIGALLKHIIGVLLLCWRRMLRAGLIAFGIGAVVTVLVTVLGTGEAIPSESAFVVALLFGLALAYGVAMTVLVEELILGVIDLIRMIEGDISAGAHITEVVAEREVGQVGQGLRRLLGLPVSKRASARPGATLPPLTRARPQGQPAPTPARPAASAPVDAMAGAAVAGAAALAGATRRAELAGEVSASAMPDSADTQPGAARESSGEPVPADRLPRITWTYEHEAIRPPATPSQPSAPAVEPVAEAVAPISAASTPVTSEIPAALSTPSVSGAPEALAEVAGGAMAASVFGSLASPDATLPTAPSAPETPALEAAYDDERLAIPTTVTTPEGPAEPAERVDDATEDADTVIVAAAQPAPSTTPLSSPEAAPGVVASEPKMSTPLAGEGADTQPVAVVDASQAAEAAGRADFARRTLPLGGASATLEGPRTGVPSGPRPSAPESGLWERLSNALINRAGAPSGPFAPAPPLTTGEPVTDESSHEPGSGEA